MVMSKKGFVMDCSVTMAMFLADEKKSEVLRYEEHLRQGEAYVPTIWHYEVANVCCMALRRERITEAELIELKSVMAGLAIKTDLLSKEIIQQDVLSIAIKEKITVYDAAYLELALRKNMPLATLDKVLKKVVFRLGGKLV